MPKLTFHDIDKSSNISGAHYDEKSKQLTIRFKNGGVYRYDNITKDHYDGLLEAESVGRYFQTHLRYGGYAYNKLKVEDYDQEDDKKD